MKFADIKFDAIKAKLSNLAPMAAQRGTGQMLAIFSAGLIFGVGGVLYILRSNTDDYSPVALSTVPVLLLSLSWLFALVLYVGLLVCSKARTGLQNTGAIIVVVGFFEMVGMGFFTYRTFTHAPRNLFSEQRHEVAEYVMKENATLPRKVNEFITLRNIGYMGSSITFYYELAEKEGLGWDEKTMHDSLTADVCGYFKNDSRYRTINTIRHVYLQGKEPKFNFVFLKKKCLHPELEDKEAPAAPPTSNN